MEQVLHLGQQLGTLVGQVVTLGEVVTHVVELPGLLWAVERRRTEPDPRDLPVETGSHEPVVIDTAVAHHLEVLGAPAVNPGIGERGQHRLALDGHLLDAVHHGRGLDARRGEDGGRQVDDVVKLVPEPTGVGDVSGPRNGQAVAGPPEVRRHLLHPLERCVQGPRPPDVVVALTSDRAEVVDVLEQELGVLLLPVLKRGQGPGPVDATLGRRPVVTGDVDEEGVVPLAHGLDGVDEAGHLSIGVSQEGREHFHQATGHWLVPVGVVIPGRDLVGSGSVLRARWNDPHGQLSLEDRLAQVIPAVVKEAAEAVQPGVGNVQRRVDGAGSEVAQERLVRSVGPDPLHPLDGLVGHVLSEVVVVPPLERGDRRGLVVEVGLELRGFAAQEPVEAVKAQPGGPAVERSRRAGLPRRGQVTFAEHPCGVAVLAEHLSHRGRLPGDDRVEGRVGGRRLGDMTHVHGVVVAAGEHRGPGGGADGRGVEPVETQAVSGHPLQAGSRDRSAESPERPEAHVVQEDDHHVGRPLGSALHLEGNRLAVLGQATDGAGVRRGGSRDGGHGRPEPTGTPDPAQ